VDLRDYLSTLRKRWATVVICVLLAVGAAAALTLLTQKEYTSTASIFISARPESGGGISGAYEGSLFAQDRVKSYAEVAQSRTVTNGVAAALRLDPDTVAGKIRAESPDNTVLIHLTVVDTSARRAQAITAATAEQLTTVIPQLERPTGTARAPVKVTIVEPASLPTTPSAPRPVLSYLVGLLLGLLIGSTVAVVRELLDTRVKTMDDLQRVTGSSPLGLIRDDPGMAKRPLVVQVDGKSPRAEAYRQLRTNLQYVHVDKPLRTIVVTSAIPGEGKSVTSCNLAITLADAGLSVLLVEADLRRPRVSEYMGLEGAVGLTSVLTGEASLVDALQPWGQHGLQVLPSGPLPPNPSELLGSQQMHDLLEALRDQVSIVILDTPPMLPVTDAAVLARKADGALLVVRARKTKREQVQRCLELLHGVDSRLLGTVLNRAAVRGPDANQADGFDYGYYSLPDGRDAPKAPAGGRRAGALSRSRDA
jgi:capsular exopolysaccharide synthesis family protein